MAGSHEPGRALLCPTLSGRSHPPPGQAQGIFMSSCRDQNVLRLFGLFHHSAFQQRQPGMVRGGLALRHFDVLPVGALRHSVCLRTRRVCLKSCDAGGFGNIVATYKFCRRLQGPAILQAATLEHERRQSPAWTTSFEPGSTMLLLSCSAWTRHNFKSRANTEAATGRSHWTSF